MPRRRRLTRPLLHLSAAIAATYLTAWSCALWQPIILTTSPLAWTGTRSGAATGYRITLDTTARGADGQPLTWHGLARGRFTAGWPLPALHAQVVPYQPAPHSPALSRWELPLHELLRRGIPTNDLPPILRAHRERRLPILPLWPGFAANTLLCLSTTLTLAHLATTARRQTRRRRNLCPTCAYPLASLPPATPCPECGHPPHPPCPPQPPYCPDQCPGPRLHPPHDPGPPRPGRPSPSAAASSSRSSPSSASAR